LVIAVDASRALHAHYSAASFSDEAERPLPSDGAREPRDIVPLRALGVRFL